MTRLNDIVKFGKESYEVIEHAISNILGTLDGMFLLDEQYTHELRIRNETFYTKFSAILKKCNLSIDVLRRKKDFVNRAMIDHAKSLEARNVGLQRKILELNKKGMGSEKEVIGSKIEIKKLKKHVKNLETSLLISLRKKEGAPHSVSYFKRQDRRRNHASGHGNGKNLKQIGNNASSGSGSPLPVKEVKKEVKKSNVGVNTDFDEKENGVTLDVLSPQLLDELLLVKQMYYDTKQKEYFGSTEKRMVWDKIKILLELNHSESFYDRKLEFLARKRDEIEKEMQKEENRSFSNRFTYYESKLEDIKKKIALNLENRYLSFTKQSNLVFSVESNLEKRISRRKNEKLQTYQDVAEHPTGKVAIIFTDIYQSTKLWERDVNTMIEALNLHNKIIRKYVKLCGGYEVKTEGDSFMLVFHEPFDALVCCLKIQLSFLSYDWPDELNKFEDSKIVKNSEGLEIFKGLRVRIGMNVGIPAQIKMNETTERYDYFGPCVNKAARIEAISRGGEICISQQFYDEVQNSIETNKFFDQIPILVTDRGKQKLKGFKYSENVYSILPKMLEERKYIFKKEVISLKKVKKTKTPSRDKPRRERLRKRVSNRVPLYALHTSSSLSSVGAQVTPPSSLDSVKRPKKKLSQKRSEFVDRLSKAKTGPQKRERRKKVVRKEIPKEKVLQERKKEMFGETERVMTKQDWLHESQRKAEIGEYMSQKQVAINADEFKRKMNTEKFERSVEANRTRTMQQIKFDELKSFDERRPPVHRGTRSRSYDHLDHGKKRSNSLSVSKEDFLMPSSQLDYEYHSQSHLDNSSDYSNHSMSSHSSRDSLSPATSLEILGGTRHEKRELRRDGNPIAQRKKSNRRLSIDTIENTPFVGRDMFPKVRGDKHIEKKDEKYGLSPQVRSSGPTQRRSLDSSLQEIEDRKRKELEKDKVLGNRQSRILKLLEERKQPVKSKKGKDMNQSGSPKKKRGRKPKHSFPSRKKKGRKEFVFHMSSKKKQQMENDKVLLDRSLKSDKEKQDLVFQTIESSSGNSANAKELRLLNLLGGSSFSKKESFSKREGRKGFAKVKNSRKRESIVKQVKKDTYSFLSVGFGSPKKLTHNSNDFVLPKIK